MPIYLYKCENCGHELEALQKISAEPLTDCPKCQESRLAKQVTAPNFRLKGSGWYETDFKSTNQKNLASQDSGGESSSHQCGAGCPHKH